MPAILPRRAFLDLEYAAKRPDWRSRARDALKHEAGVRAVRFNLYRGGSADLADLERLALRVHELAGWHAELYVDSKDLPDLEGRLAALPRISIDHLGITREGYPALLRLVGARRR